MLLKNQGHQQTNIDIKIFLSPPTQPLLTDSATNSIMNSANMYLFLTQLEKVYHPPYFNLFSLQYHPINNAGSDQKLVLDMFLTLFLYEKEPFTCNFFTRNNTKNARRASEGVIHGISTLNLLRLRETHNAFQLPVFFFLLFSILLQNSNYKFPPHSFKNRGLRWSWWGLEQHLSCHKTG